MSEKMVVSRRNFLRTVACASAAAVLPLKEILAAPEISGRVVAAKLSWRPLMSGREPLAWRSRILGLIPTRPDSQFSITAAGVKRSDLYLPPHTEAVQFELTRDVEREKKFKNRLMGDWLVHSIRSEGVVWEPDQLEFPTADCPTPDVAPRVQGDEPWIQFRTFDDDQEEGFCFTLPVLRDIDLRIMSRARS